MKILWVKTDFLHPTTKGGRSVRSRCCGACTGGTKFITSPSMIRQNPEGPARGRRVLFRAYPCITVRFRLNDRLAFYWTARARVCFAAAGRGRTVSSRPKCAADLLDLRAEGALRSRGLRFSRAGRELSMIPSAAYYFSTMWRP